jgi:glycosyltransferase involved in cell wall biosynthesis
MSGETAVPLYYFKGFLERGVDVRMVLHARTRQELRDTLTDDEFARLVFIEDRKSQVALADFAELKMISPRVRALLLYQLVRSITQRQARKVVKRIVATQGADAVFEPFPIAPQAVSHMYDVGAPVIVGPLCGGLDFPPGFRYMDRAFTQVAINAARAAAPMLHRIIPGKLRADAVIVANERTANALPPGCTGKRYTLIESGVDLSLWEPVPYPRHPASEPTRFLYFARFVDWKGIEFLVDAFARVVPHADAQLVLIGDGELFDDTKTQVARHGLEGRVRFHGRLPLEAAVEIMKTCDVYMATGLRECGGLALLEAMASGTPVIACNWAGPGEYVDETCGVLVDPSSREEYIDGLAEAMIELARDPERVRNLGAGAAARVQTQCFGWDAKIGRALEIIRETVEQAAAGT